MSGASFLGLDVGTSGVKAILVAESGEIEASATTPLELSTPKPGWAEQHPEDWWKASVSAIRQVLKRSKLAPTQIAASRARNVIPGACELTVDCRLLPGQLPADVEPELVAALEASGARPGSWELEWIEQIGGTRSPLETPLWDALAAFVTAAEPGALLLPVCNAGFTDSHYLREAFGTVAYGFFPLRAMAPELAARIVHSANERVPVDDLELGVEMLRHAAQSLL